jgi:Flp pilus assembly protein TadD
MVASHAVRRHVLVLGSLLALLPGPWTPGAGAASGPIPEKILSWRLRTLSSERYRELRDQWKAYAEAHPTEAVGWAQLARASRYAGEEKCDVNAGYARKAVEVDPSSAEAHAALGGFLWNVWCPSSPEDPQAAIDELERALELDPTLDEPHYSLWVLRLYQGKQEAADQHLRTLLLRGHIPAPVVDFGYNLLIGLPPDAVLLTNGDNDTYPPLALQVARGIRPDVAIVNLSLLNTQWYRQHVRESAKLPVPLLEKEPSGLQSPAAVSGLAAELASAGWKRPLYVAITVPPSNYPLPNQLSLEGLAYRVLPQSGKEQTDDLAQIAANLKLYRLESATNPGFDWSFYNSVARGMTNYAAVRSRLASGLARSGEKERARTEMNTALQMCELLGLGPSASSLIEDWAEWDAGGAELARWKAKQW